MKVWYVIVAAIVLPFGGTILAYHYLRAADDKRRDLQLVTSPLKAAHRTTKNIYDKAVSTVRDVLHTEHRPDDSTSGVPTAQA